MKPTTIELLEARLAPAAVFTYTDSDGDVVTIKTSEGTDEHLADATAFLNNQFQRLDLSKATWGEEFAGSSITMTVKKGESGDGKAHVGFINAEGIDLNAVTIKGDLGQIDAGDTDLETNGIKTLTVASLGQFGADTQGGAGSLYSSIKGDLLKLRVAGNIAGASVDVAGELGSMNVGGSLIGGVAEFSGFITVSGGIDQVKIKGDLVGGTGIESDFLSGAIVSSGKIGSLSIGGSLLGGSNRPSGVVRADDGFGRITIRGDIVGGPNDYSGRIVSGLGSLSNLTIGGSLIGGSGDDSGAIIVSGDLGRVKIGGSMVGGSMAANDGGIVVNSGSIYCEGRIASVAIAGAMIAGHNDSNAGGIIRLSACITAGDDIGSVKVAGSIVGNEGAYASITARGQQTPGASQDLAIGKITVGGSVAYVQFIGGYAFDTDGIQSKVNGDASIGAVKIAGSWTASYLAAGIDSVNNRLADGDDIVIAANDTALISRIASIVIGGEVVGTPTHVSAVDCFGFAAQQIGSFKASGVSAKLTSGTDDPIFLSLPTGDVGLREVV